MFYSDEDIQHFLHGQVKPDEGRRIARFLRSLGEDTKLYADLLAEWYDTEETPLEDPALKEKMLLSIQKQLHHDRQRSFRKYIRYGAAAIVGALLIGAAVWFIPRTANVVVKLNKKEFTTEGRPWIDTANNGVKDVLLALSDGSLVRLYPGAHLRYFRDTANIRQRNLYLEGKAFFEVAKDKARPFTVHTGTVATTALGTSFSVSTNGGHIRVKLYTGKVWLRKEQNVSRLLGWKKDLVLVPGQSMNYDSVKARAVVAQFPLLAKTKNALVLQRNNGNSGKLLARKVKDSLPGVLTFNNTPLITVFHRMEKQFSIKIQYRSQNMEGLQFSGQVYGTDAPENVLRLICNLNDLSLIKERTNYKVEKK